MSTLALSEVQYLNLMTLTILHEAILRDPVEACTTFGLRRDQLAHLEKLLAPDRILAAVANAGHESLFSLRAEAIPLLARPAPLLGALLSVRAPLDVAEPSPEDPTK